MGNTSGDQFKEIRKNTLINTGFAFFGHRATRIETLQIKQIAGD